MAKKKVAVLISGRGTNLQSLIDACADERFPAEIALVVSNRPEAPGLERAKRAGAPTLVIDHLPYGKGAEARAAFDAALSKALKEAGIDLVCLAGFMRILSAEFVKDWEGRLLNIHPSLLPAFKGLNVHQRMIEAGVKIAGCTVHFVSPEMDSGPIIGQAAVPVLAGDDADLLAARILKEEHRLYPACVKLVAEGRARLVGDVVEFDKTVPAGAPLLNPRA
ncbi:MAG TPA: phosphoribosylglycinamide formyltransferase [Parvularculaceae bacterium]|nr:phosphoribosylglycinamide formyltransferase [Parvularculaceae bacterium]